MMRRPDRGANLQRHSDCPGDWCRCECHSLKTEEEEREEEEKPPRSSTEESLLAESRYLSVVSYRSGKKLLPG